MFTSLHKQPKHFYNANSSFDKSRTPFSSSATTSNTNSTSNHNMSLLSSNPISKTTTFHNYLHFNNSSLLHKNQLNESNTSKNTTLSFLKKSFLLSPSPPKPSNPDSSYGTISAYKSSGFPHNLKSKITAIINRKHPSSSTATTIHKALLNENDYTNEHSTSMNSNQRFIKSNSASDLRINKAKNGNSNSSSNKSVTMTKLTDIHRLLCDSNSSSVSVSNIHALRHNIYESNKQRRFVRETNPHVDVFGNKYNIRNVNKSLSYQRLEHMKKVIDLQVESSVKTAKCSNHNHKRKGSVNESELHEGSMHRSSKNIFTSTRELRIKNKIRMLNNFTIFPNYNTRKIDVELRKKYVNNNLNIIGSIKDKFTKNINDNELSSPRTNKTKSELTDELTVDDIM